MAFAAPAQGYGAPVFNPTQAPTVSSNPINPRLLLLHQLLRSPDQGYKGQPGIHWFGPGGSGIAYPGNPGAGIVNARPGETVPAPGSGINVGFHHAPPGSNPDIGFHLPLPQPVPATGIAPPSEPGGVPGPTQDEAAAIQAMQDQANLQPHPAVAANIAAVQQAHAIASQLAAHIANRNQFRPVRLRRGNAVT